MRVQSPPILLSQCRKTDANGVELTASYQNRSTYRTATPQEEPHLTPPSGTPCRVSSSGPNRHHQRYTPRYTHYTKTVVRDIRGDKKNNLHTRTHNTQRKMCYFEQTLWACGYWKWGNFREQCNKEYRTGETCGLKLVYDTSYQPGQCKICDQISKKDRRVRKMSEDILRWQREGNRRATIEKTQQDISEIQIQINELWHSHQEKQRSIC